MYANIFSRFFDNKTQSISQNQFREHSDNILQALVLLTCSLVKYIDSRRFILHGRWNNSIIYKGNTNLSICAVDVADQ